MNQKTLTKQEQVSQKQQEISNRYRWTSSTFYSAYTAFKERNVSRFTPEMIKDFEELCELELEYCQQQTDLGLNP